MLLVGYFPAITISGALSECLPGRKTWLTSHGVKKQDSSEKFLGEHPEQWEICGSVYSIYLSPARKYWMILND